MSKTKKMTKTCRLDILDTNRVERLEKVEKMRNSMRSFVVTGSCAIGRCIIGTGRVIEHRIIG